MMSMRTRWAAIGAAVAVTLGAGGISLGQAAISSGDKPVFVGIEPCRLVDTRPGDDNIGERSTPLGANDTLTLQIPGSTGQCTGIPADATAAAMNVTAIQGSTRSFLTIYPADAALPLASNLNWNGGDPPTPNKVDVKLGTTGPDAGKVKITNDAGTVHVAADLVGYYIDHTHDDRYYTKDQTEPALDVYTGELAVAFPPSTEATLVGDSYPRPLPVGTPPVTFERITPPTFSTNCPGIGESATVGVLCLYEYDTANVGSAIPTDGSGDSLLHGYSLAIFPAAADPGYYIASWALRVPPG